MKFKNEITFRNYYKYRINEKVQLEKCNHIFI